MLPGQSERGGVCGQCLVKWTETECGLSCISHWLPCYALALGITLFWCASKTRKAKEEADSYTGDAEHLCFPRAWPCSAFPQNLSVGCSLAAVHVTLSSIPWHLREMQFSNVACRFLFWVTLQVLSLNTVSHMHACFPAHRKKEWARTKLLASIQFPWSDRCCICRYSPCPHPLGGLEKPELGMEGALGRRGLSVVSLSQPLLLSRWLSCFIPAGGFPCPWLHS